jgi:arylsulfatase A-like enzyme
MRCERFLAAILGLVWAFAPHIVSASDARPTRPNIIVILTDDQGRGDYSAFGTKDIRTPHMDRLFREGAAFDNFFANSCVCSPSRAALLTGRYPDRVGVPGVIREETPDDSWGYLAAGVTLLPQVLKKAGYDTALIGKWHLGIGSPNTPTERGFDFFEGFLGDMMDDYWTHLRHGHNFMRRNLEVIDPKGHATDVFTGWAYKYLAQEAKHGKPFFLYLAYNAPHDPIQPPPEWLERVKHRESGMDPRRAKLVALIEHLDHGIGQVMDTLDRTGLATNTLVIFTSDNGGVLANGANNGPWRGGKHQMYEGGLRVPGAAWWPAQIRPGLSISRMTMTMDIFPTACEAAGVAPPEQIDATSFLSVLREQRTTTVARDLYFVCREGGKGYGGGVIDAFRRGDWKLLQESPYSGLELYDLHMDPMEGTNEARTQPGKFDELLQGLQRRIQLGGAVPWQPPVRR